MTAAPNADMASVGQPQSVAADPAPEKWDPRSIQEKWLAKWDAINPYQASDDPADARPRRYVLDMFPYPSGDLHMGHAEAYAVGDAMARYYFQRGDNVLHPIGWDAFGLPAENAAIRDNSHPANWTYKNIDTQAASFRRYALSFDWTRRLHTCDPEYYRWNAVAVPAAATSGAWPTVATATSIGAQSTRPCWPTSRWLTVAASAAAMR